MEYRIPAPPDFVFANKGIKNEQQDPSKRVFKEAEKQPLFTIIGQEFPEEKDGGGIFLHYKELKYPRKGFPYPEAVYEVNFAKRQIISWLRFFAKKQLILPYLGFLILSWSTKIKLLSGFLKTLCDCINIRLGSFYLQPRYFMAPAKELARYVKLFLENIGISQDLADEVGGIISMAIEYDTAYCWRIQDIFSEINKDELLKNPGRELDRLFNIFQKREGMSDKVKEHFRSMVTLLKLALKLGKIKKAFISATKEIDLNKIAFTQADKYQVMFFKGYDFMGKTFEERQQILKDMHGGVIPTGPFRLTVN